MEWVSVSQLYLKLCFLDNQFQNYISPEDHLYHISIYRSALLRSNPFFLSFQHAKIDPNVKKLLSFIVDIQIWIVFFVLT